MMRKIGVHSQGEIIAAFSGKFQAADDTCAQAEFRRPVDDEDAGRLSGDFLGQLPGAIRGIIVYDQDVDGRGEAADFTYKRCEIFPLIISAKDN